MDDIWAAARAEELEIQRQARIAARDQPTKMVRRKPPDKERPDDVSAYWQARGKPVAQRQVNRARELDDPKFARKMAKARKKARAKRQRGFG